MINISFKPAGIVTAKNGYLLGSLTLLAFVGVMFLRSVKPQNSVFENESTTSGVTPDGLQIPATSVFTLGSMLFNAETRKLLIHEKTIDLTKTETRVLLIFAISPNEVIARSRLQKEIWEDAGVIVGRSLDMFISKLRKKLEADPTVRIAVIRGKGYKLEINA